MPQAARLSVQAGLGEDSGGGGAGSRSGLGWLELAQGAWAGPGTSQLGT